MNFRKAFRLTYRGDSSHLQIWLISLLRWVISPTKATILAYRDESPHLQRNLFSPTEEAHHTYRGNSSHLQRNLISPTEETHLTYRGDSFNYRGDWRHRIGVTIYVPAWHFIIDSQRCSVEKENNKWPNTMGAPKNMLNFATIFLVMHFRH